MTGFDRQSERVLVLAPIGRDAAIASSILAEAGVGADAVGDMSRLLAELDRGMGAVLIAEEAVENSHIAAVSAWLERQPAWSDLPIIILTHHGGGPERNPRAAQLAQGLGNVTFVERPFHPTTLVSVATAALRGRRRQYEARARIENVHEAEARLRVALKAGQLGSWLYDIGSGELNCSNRCKAIFGRTPDQSLTYEELKGAIHPDDRAAMRNEVAHSVATGDDYEIQYRVVWPDGSTHWVEIRARVTQGADGRSAQLIGVSLDITERKRLEETLAARVMVRTAELEASERRFRAVFDSAFQMSILLDLHGRVMLANRTALDLIGQSLPAVVGMGLWETPWWKGVPGEAHRLRQEVPKAVEGTVVRYEATLELGDGVQRVLDFSLKPVRDESDAVVQIVAEGRDISELKRTEATLRQSQKMETIGQLTGGVAHDFNNLLMVIISNLDLLRRRANGDQQLHRLVENAMHGAERGAALTQRLLAFARRQDLQPQAVDVAKLIEGMRPLLQQSLGPMVTVRTAQPNIARSVLVDPNQLELAILNLALNSRDAMPDGGSVTISFDEISAENLRDQTIAPGDYLRLRFTDTGCGMDEATLQSAIEPFFSTKGVGKGTGLGLSMIHGLAIQSGGTLRLSSEVGVGTTAELVLPVTTEAGHEDSPLASSGAGEATPATVLLVDDDALIAMSTAMMLEDLGHRVVQAHSAADALKVLRSSSSVDLLLTDHAMPEMTGAELARRAREIHPRLPVLLATGYADLPDSAGVDLPRLTKPYGQTQLAAELARLLPRTQ